VAVEDQDGQVGEAEDGDTDETIVTRWEDLLAGLFSFFLPLSSSTNFYLRFNKTNFTAESSIIEQGTGAGLDIGHNK
jgi:hypothetical protein